MLKISIALCTYNGDKYLRKQLNSIINQTYPIDEIIIVDDCSTDNTREILLEFSGIYSNIKLYFNEENLNSNHSFKKAISLTNNQFIALCDQDDIWDLDKIERQMKLIKEQNSDLSKPLLVFHDLALMDSKDNNLNISFWEELKFNIPRMRFKNLLRYNVVTGCTCIINDKLKNELLKANFNNIIMHDYFIALIAYGIGNVLYINNTLMQYRIHTDSVTSKKNPSFFERVKRFKNSIYSDDYLDDLINQGIEFHHLYKDVLLNDKRKQLSQFIDLKDKNILQKLFYRWLVNP